MHSSAYLTSHIKLVIISQYLIKQVHTGIIHITLRSIAMGFGASIR